MALTVSPKYQQALALFIEDAYPNLTVDVV